jgi:hypothetical protein
MHAGAAAGVAKPARLPALHRGSRLATECFDSAQAALHTIERERALPAPSIALKPSTWLAGLDAGGDDARTARERSVSLRPREPHSLPSVSTLGRKVPRRCERDGEVSNLFRDKSQQKCFYRPPISQYQRPADRWSDSAGAAAVAPFSALVAGPRSTIGSSEASRHARAYASLIRPTR